MFFYTFQMAIGHHVKFLKAIFRIFKMAAAAIFDFWNCEILLAICVERVETHQHAKLRQNRSISCEDIMIFDFSRWRLAGLSNSQNFIGWRCLEGQDTSLCLILLKSVVPLWRYCIFSNFWNGRRRYLGFLKSWNFIGCCSGEGQDA